MGMDRGAWAALAAAMAAFAAGQVQSKDWPLDPPRLERTADAPTQRAWLTRYVDQDGWQVVDFGGAQYWLVSAEQATANAYPIVRDWVRIEKARAPDPNLMNNSSLWQVEVDCSKAILKPIRYIDYRYNNLRGPVLSDLIASESDARKLNPGSILAVVADSICRAAATASP